ncbi:YhcN/YlaJ family sporulation lipoprotein [Anaerobacillus sp. MEB173]|uniref:YhcN/YlaJ family sporulation lipoprotein n=1 Tax=Anaerobacillus sp. MEB173 TaxID=3383345 RepID=UPI003F8DB83C
MKKLGLALGLSVISILTGCQMDNQSPLAVENHDHYNVREDNENYNILNYSEHGQNHRQRFGYVRYQSGTTALAERSNETMIYDRELIADEISRLALNVPGVYDVATLVTDSEVLVAYLANTKDRADTADQVKQTAFSLVPRFYNVHVSDKQGMIQSIERYSGLSNSNDHTIKGDLDETIKEMKKSPQGRNLGDRDNESRQMKREIADNAKRD